MHVRDAKNREEVWLLDQLEAFGFEDPAFRSRDYVIAIDEEAGRKVGFGRIRVHSSDPPVCEVTCVGVLEDWRGQGVGAHILERLVELGRDQGFDRVVVFTSKTGYLKQFGFEEVSDASLAASERDRLETVRESSDPNAVALRVGVDEFSMPRRLRRRFADDERREEAATEDFGIDTESATYKYDTGRR
ncbi:GNAT family N-acetyltransferase [Halanaeroarchaeum sulfurireducens]|uniref:N-acetyltransferase GCN5 n=1 Tax=Halanaeroarchaeum sulfurireducens TaxID=1604004 RepID=A0A0F7P7X7_9EURY|nr:GNAT family N-acetyltransferase [Halanaeroarchaeum sulfurireducens]AKH97246.1 N-acetyltransferase GCN5 [Halanaeroarchaeum sulfurireducens]ALG81648.1 N-acetyltransferase GCN5 [Halanaeroarchaeum sulfurireducens]